MSEVEKLYKKAKIEPEINYVCDKEPCKKSSLKCCADIGCSHLYDIREDYPDFTAEKQLELIKWLARFDLRIEYTNAKYFIESHRHGYSVYTACFEQALAKFINILWQDLTETERNEIRDILRG